MEILGILLLVPLGGITAIALFASLSLLLPASVEKTRHNLENALGRSLLLGVVNFIFFAVLTAAFIWIGQNGSDLLGAIFFFLAGVILLGSAIFMLFGLTAFGNLLGERMGGGKTPFASSLRGGALLLLAGLAPYIGWFIFTPLILWAGFGAAISALIRKPKKAKQIEDA
jgi:hypothetical protein